MAVDDHIAYEYALEVVTDLRGRLTAGARGSGLKLTADECDVLARWLVDPPRPKGRPPGNPRTAPDDPPFTREGTPSRL
jgi:hypothetical protein